MASFKNNGKLKLLIIVGTRPEIIRLAAVINKCREYFDCLLAHTGQNYDYNLNGVFFKDLKLADPDVYMEAVGADLGETMGNIIAKSYQLMVEVKPDAVLVLGDTNSCLSVIGAKRLHIPIFQAEAVVELFKHQAPNEPEIRVIGIRHGEKMYETLLTKEEAAKAIDMGNFYAVPADNRDLNYDKFFKEGDAKRATIEEFNSDNTYRLDLEETKAKIASLEYIQNELNGIPNIVK